MTEQRVETIEEFNARMEATIADEDQPELPIENESDEVEETEEMDPHVAFDKAKEKFIKRKLVDALFSNECGWVLGNKHPKNKLMKFFWDICLKEDLITTKADGSALRKPKLPYLTKDQTPEELAEVVLQYMEMRSMPKLDEWTNVISQYALLASKVEDFESLG